MTGQDLLKAFGEIDDRFIEEADRRRVPARRFAPPRSLIAAAAALIVLVGVGIALRYGWRAGSSGASLSSGQSSRAESSAAVTAMAPDEAPAEQEMQEAAEAPAADMDAGAGGSASGTMAAGNAGAPVSDAAEAAEAAPTEAEEAVPEYEDHADSNEKAVYNSIQDAQMTLCADPDEAAAIAGFGFAVPLEWEMTADSGEPIHSDISVFRAADGLIEVSYLPEGTAYDSTQEALPCLICIRKADSALYSEDMLVDESAAVSFTWIKDNYAYAAIVSEEGMKAGFDADLLAAWIQEYMPAEKSE